MIAKVGTIFTVICVNTYGNICQRALKIMSPVDLIIISFLGIYPKKINRKIQITIFNNEKSDKEKSKYQQGLLKYITVYQYNGLSPGQETYY